MNLLNFYTTTLLLLNLLPCFDACDKLKCRPIIGILAQSCGPSDSTYGDTYIPSTYVKWVESGGARAVPIRVKKCQAYYDDIFKKINGIVFPGGGVNILTSEFAKAAKILYNKAIQANDQGDYFPLWGTCQGFQLLSALTSGKNLLSARHVLGMRPLLLTKDASQSRLFKNLPTDILTSLTSYNVTANHHNWGLSTENFTHNEALQTFYKVLSTNVADNGKDFISTFEAFKYPFYGVQWHPEKVPYDWDLKDALEHTQRGVQVTQYFADFFIQECRRSKHSYPTIEEEISSVFSNYPIYFSHNEHFSEHYYFNYTRKNCL